MIFAPQLGLNFAYDLAQKERFLMNPSGILGGIALTVGGGLLLSEVVVGQELLTEMTGTPLTTLWSLSGLVFLLGVLALGLSIRDAKEFSRDEPGVRR